MANSLEYSMDDLRAQIISLTTRLDNITLHADNKCEKYARFMRDLSHKQADGVFWCLVLFQVICLVVTVQSYASVTGKLSKLTAATKDPSVPRASVEQHELTARRSMKKCLIWSSSSFVLLMFTTIIQVFAAHTILFCHHEDLMHLYFPTWTVVSIGITFATAGCCLAQTYALKSKTLPPFGLAFGTPVLVISGASHFLWNLIRKTGNKSWSIEDGLQPRISKASTSKPLDGARPTMPTRSHSSLVPDHGNYIGNDSNGNPTFLGPCHASTSNGSTNTLTTPDGQFGQETRQGSMSSLQGDIERPGGVVQRTITFDETIRRFS